jgi:hypothetical protein
VGPADSASNVKGSRQRTARFGRSIKIAAVCTTVLFMAGLGYWALDFFKNRTPHKPAPAHQPSMAQTSPDPAVPNAVAPQIASGPQPPADPTPAKPTQDIATSSSQPKQRTFSSLESDLAGARRRVSDKIDEIVKLVAYYQNGIEEEQLKIRGELKIKPAPSLDQALADSQIELSLRAIQRRHAYISKLDEPLGQLKAASEELLFLQRRTRLFETLSQWISAPSMPQYKQEITNRIQTQMNVIKGLSADNSQVEMPSMASVWNEVQAGLEKEKALNANRFRINAQDKQISREICGGKYDRKYLLTHLSEETASCLIQWSGKDLYLNSLTGLSPQVARILSKWPGEWLSLNGVKEISAETAKYLSQWPGKRLSLNGLQELSPQATAELSQWKGEQLEMIGLTAIGPWENYGTRLYLSETMRRKLQL